MTDDHQNNPTATAAPTWDTDRLEEVGVGGGRWRFKGQRLHFTYRGHIPKGEIKGHILMKARTVDTLKYVYAAHEEPDPPEGAHPYQHTHVLVDFGKSIDFTDARRFDFGDVHPHMKPVKTMEHWRNARKYLGKEDPENADLLEKPSLVGAVFACKTKAEALQKWCAPDLHNASAILTVFENKPQGREARPLPDPYPWQAWLIDFVTNQRPDDRTVWWIHDPRGRSGKSRVTNWLADQPDRHTITLKTIGNVRDFATNIVEELDAGWTGRACIFDFSRQNEERQIYEQIEWLKDGRVTASKYKGGTRSLDPPHVIVTCNHLPMKRTPSGRLTLTPDRWRILEIRPDGKDFTDATRARCKLPPSVAPEGAPRIFEEETPENHADIGDQKDPPNDSHTVAGLRPSAFGGRNCGQPTGNTSGIAPVPADYFAMLDSLLADLATDAHEWDPDAGAYGAADP